MKASWILKFIVIVGVFGLNCFSEAHFNLYMNGTETKRLLGISGDLYYVRDGNINEYALMFNVPIKNDVTDIYFDWQSLQTAPTDPQMYYSIGVYVTNGVVMGQPSLSILKDGTVPVKPSVFSIALPCNGISNGEVDVRIQLNVTMFSAANFTVLELKRKKTCLKENSHYSGDVDEDVGQQNSNASLSFAIAANEIIATSGGVFYIGVGCACGMIFIIACGLAIYFVRSTKSRDAGSTGDSSVVRPLTHEKLGNRSDTPTSLPGSSIARRDHPNGALYSELRPVDVVASLEEIQIDRTLVTLSDVMLEGTFGKIYKGTAILGDGSAVYCQKVFVKTVADHSRHDQIQVMMRDACLTKGIVHENVASIIATCIQPEHPPLLIYSDNNEGNLKKFLHRCKMSEVLSAQQLVYMAIHIARGIQHLHRRRILHRDIACRNCIIDSQLNLRITDSSLSRDIFPHDYNCLGDNENRPVKWLALEALVERKFSTASDMWSFGVTLWELFTLGQQPYSDIDPFEMATYLLEGYRVMQPINCPNELFAIMACCWCKNPEERPKFSQMQACLQDFYVALGRFV